MSQRPSLSRSLGCFALLGLVVAAIALGGCGGGSSSDSTSSAGVYISRADLTQYKEGTPQGTVLAWWRAVQFANAGAAHVYYAPQGAPTLSQLQSELAKASNQFAGIPTFNSVERVGNKATAYFFVSRPESSSASRPMSVNLVKVGASWKLADDQLLSQVVERVEASKKQSSS